MTKDIVERLRRRADSKFRVGYVGDIQDANLFDTAASLIAEARDVLADYACQGSPDECGQVQLKDGSCIRELDGTCGKAAHLFLAKLEKEG